LILGSAGDDHIRPVDAFHILAEHFLGGPVALLGILREPDFVAGGSQQVRNLHVELALGGREERPGKIDLHIHTFIRLAVGWQLRRQYIGVAGGAGTRHPFRFQVIAMAFATPSLQLTIVLPFVYKIGMKVEEYLQTLGAIEQETEQLLKERARIDERLIHLKTAADSLHRLLPEEGLDVYYRRVVSELGITDAIREILAEAKIPVSATVIKSELSYHGVDLSEYANPGAVIHNTLTRLEKQGEVVRVQNPAGQTVAYAASVKLKLLREGEKILQSPAPSPGSEKK